MTSPPPPMTATEQLQDRYAASIMRTYGIPPGGPGSRQRLRRLGRGRQRLPGPDRRDRGQRPRATPTRRWSPRSASRSARLAHTSNLYLHERQVELAERLLGLLGTDGRVFFANSGTEANEAALKLVRRAAGRRTGRSSSPPSTASTAGRMGSLAMTGKAAIRVPFEPFGVDVRFVPYGDAAALTEAVGPDCAAVFLEPTPGRGRRGAAPAGVPQGGPGGLRPGRRAAGAGRDPERHRPDRRVVRPPARGGHARRADAGQGAGRRAAHRRLHRPGRHGHRAEPGRARQHVRRQPGGLRGGARGAGHHREGRPAGQRDPGRRPAPGRHRGHRALAGQRGARHRPVAGHRAHLAGGAPRWRPRRGGPGSWSTRSSRTRSGSRRRWCSAPRRRPAFTAALPGILDAASVLAGQEA